MHPNAELIDRFYRAFTQADWATMGGCYHPNVRFTDEVFDLSGPTAAMMWRMLCTNGRDLQLEYRDVSGDASRGKAHWEARYTFSATGRKVHNVIDASFEFRDGLIVRHIDRFDFWRWSRQALGGMGLLLGWSDLLHNKVRKKAARSLASFTESVAKT
jgi:ketosteroid isomerase-like protein